MFLQTDLYADWSRVEYQQDNRNFNTLTLTGVRTINDYLSAWGFLDFRGQDDQSQRSNDFNTYFFELDLRGPSYRGFGPVWQRNMRSGTDNDLTRMGIYYRPSFQFLKDHGAFLFIKFFPYESDNKGVQISTVWRYQLPGMFKRISLGGFYDYNFNTNDDGDGKVVGEAQVRLRLYGAVSFFTEFKRNQFLPRSKQNGTGVGLLYFMK